MNNLFPAYFAKEQTQKYISTIKESTQYDKFLDIIYQTIRSSANRGKLGVEIRLKHKLIQDFPVEAVAMVLLVDLTASGYITKFADRGRFKKYKTAQIFWGLPDPPKGTERQEDSILLN